MTVIVATAVRKAAVVLMMVTPLMAAITCIVLPSGPVGPVGVAHCVCMMLSTASPLLP